MYQSAEVKEKPEDVNIKKNTENQNVIKENQESVKLDKEDNFKINNINNYNIYMSTTGIEYDELFPDAIGSTPPEHGPTTNTMSTKDVDYHHPSYDFTDDTEMEYGTEMLKNIRSIRRGLEKRKKDHKQDSNEYKAMDLALNGNFEEAKTLLGDDPDNQSTKSIFDKLETLENIKKEAEADVPFGGRKKRNKSKKRKRKTKKYKKKKSKSRKTRTRKRKSRKSKN